MNEGGGIQVDGEGTVLVTETVQLDPGRNPGITRADVEAELARTIGITHAVWLPRGLTRDSEQYGTRGHVDIVAAITSPGRPPVHTQRDEAHPDYLVCQEIRNALEASRDAVGRAWDIVEMPAPATLTDAEGFVDYSYINHLVVNGGVIACGFSDPKRRRRGRHPRRAVPWSGGGDRRRAAAVRTRRRYSLHHPEPAVGSIGRRAAPVPSPV